MFGERTFIEILQTTTMTTEATTPQIVAVEIHHPHTKVPLAPNPLPSVDIDAVEALQVNQAMGGRVATIWNPSLMVQDDKEVENQKQ